MSTRDAILNKLRRQIVDQVALPEVLEGDWIRYEDPIAQFTAAIEAAGGACHNIDSLDQLPAKLADYEEFTKAQRIFSKIDSVPGNVNLDDTPEPHELENLDFVIYPGQLAVAENGAIWLSDEDLRHRVTFFITQFLVLVVRRNQIVHTMHDAYRQIEPPKPGFGLFLSGPSKTADIEQSLVIGAHGCRELQVFVV